MRSPEADWCMSGQGLAKKDKRKVSGSRLGWYGRSSYQMVNFLLGPESIGIRKEARPGQVDPLKYYCLKTICN